MRWYLPIWSAFGKLIIVIRSIRWWRSVRILYCRWDPIIIIRSLVWPSKTTGIIVIRRPPTDFSFILCGLVFVLFLHNHHHCHTWEEAVWQTVDYNGWRYFQTWGWDRGSHPQQDSVPHDDDDDYYYDRIFGDHSDDSVSNKRRICLSYAS